MNGQLKAFQKSFLIHVVAVLAVVSFAGSARQFSKPLAIDFTLEDAAINNIKTDMEKEAPPPPQNTLEPVKNVGCQQQQPPRENPAPPPLPPILPPAVSEAQVPVMAPKALPAAVPVANASHQPVSGDISHAAAQHAAAQTSRQAVSSGPPGGAGTSASFETMKARYLKENFTYIRELVQKKAAYPNTARRFGWEGRVTVCFVVSADGSIRELKVTDSSGKKMLDESAVDAVRKAAPFPPPPVEAVLLIPVTYKLD